MKKKSFFERLAGNLRFDDNDSIDQKEILNENQNSEKRHLSLESNHELENKYEKIQKEEVGELPVDVYETPTEIIIQTLIGGICEVHHSTCIA